jgi:hypothetical protein
MTPTNGERQRNWRERLSAKALERQDYMNLESYESSILDFPIALLEKLQGFSQ